MKILVAILLLLILFFSCQTDSENSNDKSVSDESGKMNSPGDSANNSPDFNNIYNQLGNFIVGSESSQYKNIQSRGFYVNYRQKLNESWENISSKNLNSIDSWEIENQILFNDTLPLFYPFSGPDFLYANAFFPSAGSYIMVGLENPGKLPNLARMSDSEISVYLFKLYHSLRYINQNGYFTTSQMQNDFKDPSMNGIIHILLFYLAKTGHQISDINYIQVDEFGNIKEKRNFELESKSVNGLKINFYSPKAKRFKTLYYFPFDLSDENIKDKLGFITFLSNFGLKNTFLKAASYLPHNPDFKIVQDMILQQSNTILQDDSGLPYEKLLNSGFSVQLFGKYSGTTGTFEKYFQPILARTISETKAVELPFKLGYNSLKNEMILMVARHNAKEINKPITYKTEKEGVVFKVQIKSSWKKIPVNSGIFKGMPQVDYYYTDNLYKYTIGNFANIEACEEYRKLAEHKGFKDAFVVAFYQKNRISLEEAEKILSEQKNN